MHKKTVAKLAGFGIAVACTAGLVGLAASGTGAYFTSSAAGTIGGTIGTVNINTTSTSLSFNGLLPGVYQTQTFDYNVSGGSGDEDVYLEFDGVDAFQHVPQSGPTPLGRYGHLAVSGPDGSFSSFNLAQDPTDTHGNTDNNASDCQVDQYGRGGNQTTESVSTSDNHNGYCPAPQYILLSYGKHPGDSNSTASITFGFTGLLGAPAAQGTTLTPIPFKVLAVQHGILPSNPNNG